MSGRGFVDTRLESPIRRSNASSTVKTKTIMSHFPPWWQSGLGEGSAKNAMLAEDPARMGSLKNGDEDDLMPAHAPLSKSRQSGHSPNHEE